ncbi:MAG: hypothetical protein WC683_05130 [bacterium]
MYDGNLLQVRFPKRLHKALQGMQVNASKVCRDALLDLLCQSILSATKPVDDRVLELVREEIKVGAPYAIRLYEALLVHDQRFGQKVVYKGDLGSPGKIPVVKSKTAIAKPEEYIKPAARGEGKYAENDLKIPLSPEIAGGILKKAHIENAKTLCRTYLTTKELQDLYARLNAGGSDEVEEIVKVEVLGQMEQRATLDHIRMIVDLREDGNGVICGAIMHLGKFGTTRGGATS